MSVSQQASPLSTIFPTNPTTNLTSHRTMALKAAADLVRFTTVVSPPEHDEHRMSLKFMVNFG
jgi:hypothetical protein